MTWNNVNYLIQVVKYREIHFKFFKVKVCGIVFILSGRNTSKLVKSDNPFVYLKYLSCHKPIIFNNVK